MTITVRRMAFEIPDDLDPVLIAGEPEESYVNVALSLLLPYLEPYLIRSMRAARAAIDDPGLLDDLDKFNAQEGQHYRQHQRLNDVLKKRGLDSVASLEAELDADYQRFTRTKSLRWNLAYAEGFEALTSAMARIFLSVDRSKWNPVARDLFEWHLVEELEHRMVAFDVFEHVVGSYLVRLVVGCWAQLHLMRFLVRASEALLAVDPRKDGEFGGKRGRRRRERRLFKLFFGRIFPALARTWLPWYTPHRIELGPEVEALTARYTAMAKSTS